MICHHNFGKKKKNSKYSEKFVDVGKALHVVVQKKI